MSYVDRVDREASQARREAATSAPSSQTAPESSVRSSRAPARPAKLAWFFPILLGSVVGMAASIFCAIAFVASVLSLLRVSRAWYVITSERVCIQTGWLNQSLVTVDLDKVISLRANSSWLQKRFELHSIEIIHAGSRTLPGGTGLPHVSFNDAYTISHVPLSLDILATISNAWLPRDNQLRRDGERNRPA